MKKTIMVILLLSAFAAAGGVAYFRFIRPSQDQILSVIVAIMKKDTSDEENTEIYAAENESALENNTADNVVADGEAAAWLIYEDAYIIVDEDGKYIQTVSTQPTALMQISGVEIVNISSDGNIETSNDGCYKYALDAIAGIKDAGITDTGVVSVNEDNEAIISIKGIQVLLGEEEDLDKKTEDLGKFYDKVSEMNGTLNMKKADKNGNGYVFKKSS